MPAPELFGEGLPAAAADIEPDGADDIELALALGELYFCGGCGAELWEHDDGTESCCDWRPWED